jgi:CheY-like chemotaxis protein
MVKRISEPEAIGDDGVTWRVTLDGTPSPEWRQRFIDLAGGGEAFRAARVRIQDSALLFQLEAGAPRTIDAIDRLIAAANVAFGGQGEGEDSPGRRETILVVDDEPEVCAVNVEILKHEGYEVLSTCDPREALRIAERHQVDLLLTDVIMPRMRGDELAKRLVAQSPRTRVLFMSAYVVGGVLGPGAFFIVKPFNIDHLIRTVRESLAWTLPSGAAAPAAGREPSWSDTATRYGMR